MAQSNDRILVTGPYIAYQSVGTQFIGGKHSHQYNAPEPPQHAHERIVEDVAYEDLSPAASPEADSLYPFVVPAKLAELKLYSMTEFEAMYREAASGGAPKLAQFLLQYKQLGVLDFGRRNKKEIFAVLKAFFPDEIHYLYNNFTTYF